MTNKIERNDLCPCGSGKKYKKCHLLKKDNPFNSDDRTALTFKQMMQQAEVTECFYPDSSTCSSEKLKAHAIQRYRLLRNLGEKGQLIMPVRDEQSDVMETKLTRVGKNEGMIFYGFCQVHEQEIFSPIEHGAFDQSLEQIFLYNYRAFGKDTTTKREAYNLQMIAFANYSQTNEKRQLLEETDPQKLAIQDSERDKQLFDNAIRTGQLDIFHSLVFELDYEVEVVVSSVLEPERDLIGNKINDIYSDNPKDVLAKLFLNVFPEEGKSYIILSWFKRDEDRYQDYARQLADLYETNQAQCLNYLSNNVLRHSENLVIGSRLWNSWKEKGLVRKFEKDWDDNAHRVVTPTLNRLYKGKDLMEEKSYQLFMPLEDL